MQTDAKSPGFLLPTAIVVLPAVIFAIDLRMPLGAADWIWYFIPLLLSGGLQRPRLPLLLAAVFSALVIAGYFFSPPPDSPHRAWINRIAGAFALWVVACIESRHIRTEIQFRDSQAKWNTLFQILPAGISIVGKGRKFLEINPALASVLEISRTSPGKPPRAFLRNDGSPMPDEEVPSVRCIKDNQVILDAEVGIVRDDGSVTWVAVNAAPLPGVGAAVATMDITKRKQAETALAESEERYRRLFNEMTEGFALHEIICDDAGTPVDYKFLEINPAFERLTGLKQDKVVGRRFSEVLPGEDPEWLKQFGHVALTGAPVHFENFSRVINRYFEVDAYCPEPGQFAVMFLDTTARKRVELLLQEQFLELENLYNSLPIGLSVVDRQFRYLKINDRMAAINGRIVDEHLGHTIYEMIPDIAATVEPHYRRVFETGEPVLNVDVKRNTRSYPSEERHFLASYHPLKAADGHVYGLCCVLLDISSRKRVEKALAESEERFRSAMQFSGIGMAIVSATGKFLEVNPALCGILGYSWEELLAADFQSITHPDDLAADLAFVNRMLKGEIETYQMDKRYLHQAGHYIWAQLNVSLIWHRDGKSCYFVSQIQDITSRRLVQQALAESEERFRSAMEYSAIGMAVVSNTGAWLEVNPAMTAILGYSRDEFLAGNFQSITHPDDLAHCQTLLGKLAQGESKTFEVQKRYRHKAGNYLWVQSNVSAIRHPDGSTSHYVVQMQDVTERKQAGDELFRSREMLQMILDNIPQRVFWKDRDLKFMGCNLLLARDCGFASAAELIGKTDYETAYARNADIYRADDLEVMNTDRPKLNYEQTQEHPDGRTTYLLTSKVPLHDKTGQVIGVLGTYEDITERKTLETQFRQAQKMEAVGRLAGGVAHDFNNLLTIISGYSDLLLSELPEEDPSRDSLEEIKKAGERAAGLTRQLLAFSRNQVLAPDILDLNAVIGECESMLRRVLAEDIELNLELADDLGRVLADPSQLGQVLLNLVVNARDAMPQGGRLTIETGRTIFDEAFCQRQPGVKPGPYLMLVVSDTGVGMDEATKAQIFEPFFTTKQQGKGTGLGLAMVFGFIKQSGGHVTVTSEPQCGSSFRIFLPEVAAATTPEESGGDEQAEAPGSETILLVEDQTDVRTLARHMLQTRGYIVIEAANGDEAIRLVENYSGEIDLLVSDVIMPGMGGRLLAEKIVAMRPGVKVLFVSGYTDDAVMRHGVQSSETNFLHKPFTSDSLCRKVRKVLDDK